MACPRIELYSSQSDRNAIFADYRQFKAIESKATRLEGMELSLRFANASKYREILAEHLISVIRSPEQAQSIMAQCSTAWNELTNKFGKDIQRLSEEQSMGYKK
jgi:hypothetical protein